MVRGVLAVLFASLKQDPIVMKISLFARAVGAALAIALTSLTALGQVVCGPTLTESKPTPDRHCARKCRDHESRQPVDSFRLNMPDKFKAEGYYFRNVRGSCAGGSPCQFHRIYSTSAIGDGTQAEIQYKTWSRSVTITLTADVCKGAAPPAAPATGPVAGPTPAPVKPPGGVGPALPPTKIHVVSEAGAMTPSDCERMKENWRTQARTWCVGFHAQLTTLTCEADGRSPPFRKVTGNLVCVRPG